MNQKWKNFLASNNAAISDDEEIFFPAIENIKENVVFPISKLGVLSVSGSDAPLFLQGQCTINIQEITESKGSFGAFCTPKGRAICTFFIIRQKDSYLLILASELMEKVTKRLQLYILRSDVRLDSVSENFCLVGLSCSDPEKSGLNLPTSKYAANCLNDMVAIQFPGDRLRYMVLGPVDTAIELWTDLTENHQFKIANSSDWACLDLVSGIPWLNLNTSEEFIPQMINLDQLEGISFNKGCYTGQEIVARTHYLGKSKRQMYRAEIDSGEPVDFGTNIIDGEGEPHQNVGQVLSACHQNNKTMLLIVMQIANAGSTNLRIDNRNRDKIILSEITY